MSSAAAEAIRILHLTIKTVSHVFLRIYKPSIPLTLFISWTTLIIVLGATFPVLISGGCDNYEIEIRTLVTFVVLFGFSLLLAAKYSPDMVADTYVRHVTALLTLENSVIQIQNRKGVEFEMACSKKGGNHNISILPEDLLIEIFFRSSVKCLLRAKCVCKYWYGLIKEPSFAYKHLNFQKHMKKDRLLVQHTPQETPSYSYTIVDGIPQPNTTCLIRDCWQVPDIGLYMKGPVNGLYCLFNGRDHRVVLWNPALMEFKTLPLPPFPRYTVESGSIGFGVDPLTNDYKVVLFRHFCDTTDNYRSAGKRSTTVYSLSTNTWRLLDLGICSLYPFCNSFSNSFLSGTYYWWYRDGGVVLTFHMSEETFGVIPGPIIPPDDLQCDRKEWHNCTLTIYEDRVALLLQTYFLVVNIWVMLEEGMWIKQFSIQPTLVHFWPLGFCGNNGPFLVLSVSDGDYDHPVCPGSQMVLYNCITQEMSNFGLKGASHTLRACIYHESLVSVDEGTRCKGMLDRLKMVSAFLSGGGRGGLNFGDEIL